jgi:DNA-binding NtrC family response regulator
MDPTLAGPVRVTMRGGTLTHADSESTLTIEDHAVTVGRGESCSLRLADRRVSSLHCELVAHEQGVLIRDLGSMNGTWIGDFLLAPGQHGYLRRATTVRVGDSALHFTPAPTELRELAAKFGHLESRSTTMRQVFEHLQKLAMIDVAVHITGESGTGKGYIARAIHDHSSRASKPFVVIDCAAIPANLAEAELFGHERGAFTGALKRKESPFVDADGGTVLLDEVGDLSLDVQAKLLRVVEEQEVKSVGQNRYRKVDVRIVSATLHNLAARVNAGQFREDLYSRLAATRIALPPLRDRRDDIEPLCRHILADLGRADAFEAMSPPTLAWMQERAWSRGNVRQLRQVLKLAVDLARGGRLDVKGAYSLNGGGDGPAPPVTETPSEALFKALTARGTSYASVTLEASRVLFERLVRETEGNLVHMCRRAEVSRPFLRELLAKLGLREIPPPRRKDMRQLPHRP